MSRTLTTIVIVLALGGALVLGYKAFLSSPSAPSAVVATPSAGSSILPKGTDLNFEQVKKYNKDNRLFQYPVVSPSEIGPELGAIVGQ